MFRSYTLASFYLFAAVSMSTSRTIAAGELCNPVVSVSPAETSIAKLLNELAVSYDFELSMPDSLDRPVIVQDAMELEQLIKMLTAGMNTILLHENVEGCVMPRLTELTIIPSGEETEFLSDGLPVDILTKIPEPEPIIIDDMEQYVTEVLMRERKANKQAMTEQQLSEFREVKKRLKVELKDEIKLQRKQDRKLKDKDKRDKNMPDNNMQGK